MTHEFEALLRECLARQAARAPHRAFLIAALRRRRTARMWLPLVVAVVIALALTVVVSVEFRAGGELGVPPARRPPDDGLPLAAESISDHWDLRVPVEPRWLPSGLVEHQRMVNTGGTMATRFWTPGPVVDEAAQWVSLSLLRLDAEDLLFTGDQVDIRGSSGRFSPYALPGDAVLTWWGALGFRFTVTVHGLPNGREVATQIARSVESAPGEGMRLAARFGAIPAGMTPTYGGIRGASPGEAGGFLRAGAPDGRELHAEVLPVAPAELGVELTVRGREVWFRSGVGADGASEQVVVDLGGRWLVVRYFGGEPDAGRLTGLAQVAETVRFGPVPFSPWLGTRPE
ncbi:hypothetical protein [Actinokineospora iranica]|uniref:Uncharacterized protein n=1 Tax=Actinokineospora iranica TaxID=1271860 RepID=A0A1G6T217_9PSEU|nr:hypothetical protein [Actinokineospora iranica]SDD22586.1 hypothetical protein SAMN05216174_108295 [Actinokineospora iranica]